MTLRYFPGWGMALVLFGAAAAVRPAAAQDVLYREATTLRLESARTGSYVLSEQTEIEVEYVSSRATRDGSFYVGDAFFAPVEDLQGRWNGRRLGRDDVQSFVPPSEDVFLSPGKVHVLNAPSTPTPGDKMTYGYKRTYVDLAYAPILRVPNVDRVAEYRVAVDHPADVEVGFEVFAPRAEVEYRVEEETPIRTTLVFQDLEPLKELPLFPHNGYHASVLLRFANADGPILPTRPNDFAEWYRRLTHRAAPDTLSPTLRTLATSLERETEEETVSAIHDHVRGAIRYVADERNEGAFVPRAPDLVHARGYGDCKDRAFLVVALARELGIDVDVVLLSTEPVSDFDAAHFALYNHAIAAYDGEEGTVYFDPTHRYIPYGSLPEGDVDAQALRIGADGAERVTVRAPVSEPMFDVTIQSALDTPDEALATVTVRGDLFGAVREATETGRSLDVENLLSGATGEFLYKIRLDDFAPVEVGHDEATFSARADLSEFVVASPTRRYLPQTPFRTVPSEAAERTGDALPVFTEWRPDVRLVLDVDAGDLVAAPETVQFGEADAPVSFSAVLDVADGRTTIDYRFRQRARRFDGADRDAYLDLAQRYLDARRDMFIFRPAETAAETP